MIMKKTTLSSSGSCSATTSQRQRVQSLYIEAISKNIVDIGTTNKNILDIGTISKNIVDIGTISKNIVDYMKHCASVDKSLGQL